MKRLLITLAIVCCVAAPAASQELPLQENLHQKTYPGSVHKIFGWAGEPLHELPSRPDDGDEVNDDSQTYWLGQPFVPPLNVASQDELTITCNDDEADIIIIQVMIDGKPDIVAQHVRDDGTVNWNGVAGENNNQHDHWPNAFGIVTIENFSNAQDRVIVTGHTVRTGGQFIAGSDPPALEGGVTLRRDQFGPLQEGVLTQSVYSQQGANGGAHDDDTLGFIQFPGLDNVRRPQTVRTNVGVAETYLEFLALVDYYQQVHDLLAPNDDQVEVDPLVVAFLARFGLSPDDFTQDELDFLARIVLGG